MVPTQKTTAPDAMTDSERGSNQGPVAYELVPIRHGESLWNKENRFTGWHDVDLSPAGLEEARAAAGVLMQERRDFDLVYTSVLKRAIKTAWTLLDGMERVWLPLVSDWRLNERHYGALTGLDKAETAAKHGEAQVKIWRRSYDIPPPEMAANDARLPENDRRYRELNRSLLPRAESLKQTVERVRPFWLERLAPDVRSGKKILVSAHGNSIRAMIKLLENTPDTEIVELNIPTAVPILWQFDNDMKPVSRRYLGDHSQIEAKIASVASQGKAKS